MREGQERKGGGGLNGAKGRVGAYLRERMRAQGRCGRLRRRGENNKRLRPGHDLTSSLSVSRYAPKCERSLDLWIEGSTRE